jgi:DNA-binding MarR family transcriptional regulator
MTEKDDFDLRLFLPYLLNQAAEESSLTFQRVYKNRFGLLRTEWRVLFHLGIYGQLTAKEIGQRAKVHKTKISRAVQRLEQRRLLSRSRDEKDRRSEWLRLTAQGQAAYDELRQVAREYDDRLVAHLSPAQAEALRGMLCHLAGMGKA